VRVARSIALLMKLRVLAGLLLSLAWAAGSPLDGAELDAAVEGKLLLWLRAEEGVEVGRDSGMVRAWHDSKPQGIAHDFVPLPDGQRRFALGKLEDQVARASRRGHAGLGRQFSASVREDGGQATLRHTGGSAGDVGGGEGPRASVHFPCGLVCRHLQLHDQMTLFLVLRPDFFEAGDQAIGQRFFGHFPYGQLRFNDGMVAFRTDMNEFVLDAAHPIAGDWMILGFRFSGRPEASINGSPFAEMIGKFGGRGGADMVFSPTNFVTLGGTNADCGFLGDIAEVIVVDEALSDANAEKVFEYLSTKHRLQLVDRTSGANSAEALALQSAARSEAVRHAYNFPASLRGPGPGQGPGLRGSERPSQEGQASASQAALLEQMKLLQNQLDALKSQATGGNGHATGQIPEKPTIRHQYPRAGETIAPPSSEVKTNPKCLGGDAFAKLPVDTWTPPALAPIEAIQSWEDAHAKAMNEINHYDKGGNLLREFIHARVKKLRILRHKLFCPFA